MILTMYLAMSVSKSVRDRGQILFATRKVQITGGTESSVRASVKEGGGHDVTLRREDRELIATCTCGRASAFKPCEHIWATVLAADAQGLLQGKRSRPPYNLLVRSPELDDWYDEDDDFAHDFDDFDAPFGPQRTLRAPSRSAASNWKKTLSQVRSAMEQPTAAATSPVPPGQEIAYVVNVEGTLQGHGLVLEVGIRQRKQDGEWSKPKQQRLGINQIAALPDESDRQAMTMLAGAREQVANYYGYSYDTAPTRYVLNEAHYQVLVPTICRTGRCLLRKSSVDDMLSPLHWDDGGPWEFWLKADRAEKGKQYSITGELRRGEERLPLSTPVMLVAGGLVFWEDRVGLLHDFGAFAWISLLRREHAVVVPEKQKDALVAELLGLPNQPRLELPDELRYEEVRPSAQPCLKIKAPPEVPRWKSAPEAWLHGELSFDYDGQLVAANRRGPTVYDPAKRRLIHRDMEAEHAAAGVMQQAGFHPKVNYRQGPTLELAPRNLPKAVRLLLQEGWRVEAEGKLYRRPGNFHIEVTSGIDWFEMHGKASFGDQEVPLPTLLAALRRGDSLIALGDGTMGMMPEEWLKKYGLLADIGTAEGDHVRFSRTQVGLLDALLAEMPEVSVDEQFRHARKQLTRFEGIAPAEAPAGFVGELRGYQKDGLGWLHFLREFRFGGCLADDMGLGKTVQVLALLETRRKLRGKAGKRDRLPPSLAVVPRSVVFNWMQEAARFTPKLRVLDHTGMGRGKPGAHFDAYDLIVTTYGTLLRDIAELKDYRFDYAILDEAQAIKNAASQSAKASRLIQADHRLAMSGTPVQNHVGELWSLFEFLNPGMFGSAGIGRLSEGTLRNPSEDGRRMLARALRPFLLRRTKEQVAKDLPEKTEQTLYCDLEPEQRKLYNELLAHYRQSLLPKIEREGIKKSKIQILEALLRLRQAACHPALIDKKANAPSAKLDVLLPQLREVFDEGHKTLVFSQFTSLLAIVKQRLDAEKLPYEYLDGRTRDRQSRVDRFQTDPNCKLFLISLKAGGLGLNLTAADYVYLLDPWWNPAVESQAIDRAHRIGQTRPVFAYRIIARDTVEEKVLQLQEQKRALADAIITADNSVIRDLGREDLELLLS